MAFYRSLINASSDASEHMITQTHLRVIYVHVSWKIVGNSISDIQMTLISNDQLRFGLLYMRLSVCTCFSILYMHTYYKPTCTVNSTFHTKD